MELIIYSIIFLGVYVSIIPKERADRTKSMVLGIIKILPITAFIKSMEKRNREKNNPKKR